MFGKSKAILEESNEQFRLENERLKAENESQMQEFFQTHSNAKEIKIEENWGLAQIHGRQLLPENGFGDGFYYCRIQKTA